ncbi:hypothetical protein B0H13DRAFT_1878662 [Mycena leptocephala]|nr:hypothetical protein B0H13DRAFT_1878662 [Mycena leptocephala]
MPGAQPEALKPARPRPKHSRNIFDYFKRHRKIAHITMQLTGTKSVAIMQNLHKYCSKQGQALAQAQARPGSALCEGLGFSLKNLKPQPAQARPWVSLGRGRYSEFLEKMRQESIECSALEHCVELKVLKLHCQSKGLVLAYQKTWWIQSAHTSTGISVVSAIWVFPELRTDVQDDPFADTGCSSFVAPLDSFFIACGELDSLFQIREELLRDAQLGSAREPAFRVIRTIAGERIRSANPGQDAEYHPGHEIRKLRNKIRKLLSELQDKGGRAPQKTRTRSPISTTTAMWFREQTNLSSGDNYGQCQASGNPLSCPVLRVPERLRREAPGRPGFLQYGKGSRRALVDGKPPIHMKNVHARRWDGVWDPFL